MSHTQHQETFQSHSSIVSPAILKTARKELARIARLPLMDNVHESLCHLHDYLPVYLDVQLTPQQKHQFDITFDKFLLHLYNPHSPFWCQLNDTLTTEQFQQKYDYQDSTMFNILGNLNDTVLALFLFDNPQPLEDDEENDGEYEDHYYFVINDHIQLMLSVLLSMLRV